MPNSESGIIHRQQSHHIKHQWWNIGFDVFYSRMAIANDVNRQHFGIGKITATRLENRFICFWSLSISMAVEISLSSVSDAESFPFWNNIVIRFRFWVAILIHREFQEVSLLVMLHLRLQHIKLKLQLRWDNCLLGNFLHLVPLLR